MTRPQRLQILNGPRPAAPDPAGSRKRIRMQAANGVGEIFIYEDIGDSFFFDGVTAKTFAEDLKNLGPVRTLNVFINSDGGQVFQGVSIFNQLKRHKAVKNVIIDGIAASIASVIAMAGDTISIAANGFIMIHDPWVRAEGGADELERAAAAVRKVRDTLVDTYAERTGVPQNILVDMMAAETWMNADEAVDLGFADAIGDEVAIAAHFDLSKFRNVPAAASDFDLTEHPPRLHLVSDAAASAAAAPPNDPPTEAPRADAAPAAPGQDLDYRQRLAKARRRHQQSGRLDPATPRSAAAE